MDLDSRGHSKLVEAWNSGRSDEYTRILEKLFPLADRHDHETPEMWCSCIRGPFRKILEENPEIFSKNGYIRMYAKFYKDGKELYPSKNLTNYIYCSVYNFLVFISERLIGEFLY